MTIDRATLEAIVRDVVTQTLSSSSSSSSSSPTSSSTSSTSSTADRCDQHCSPPVARLDRGDHVEVARVVAASPSRLAQGRVGTRYTTAAYLRLRAEHAIALDAVHASVAEDFAARHGLIALATKVKDHDEFLLY
ncbi:MAG TPA: ethanolamine ammonia-lyase light chain EutC, partial [Myxococcota bacterium]